MQIFLREVALGVVRTVRHATATGLAWPSRRATDTGRPGSATSHHERPPQKLIVAQIA
jgi:hypothetical protein